MLQGVANGLVFLFLVAAEVVQLAGEPGQEADAAIVEAQQGAELSPVVPGLANGVGVVAVHRRRGGRGRANAGRLVGMNGSPLRGLGLLHDM